MKVLFTGATGVLGQASVPLLVADGHDVTGVARSSADPDRLAEAGARSIEADLFDAESVHQAMSGIDTVIHFATSIPPQSAMSKRSSWETNDRLRSTATELLVDAAIANGVERFIQQSVAFAYADGGDDWLDESSKIDPVWDVLESALVAESHVGRFRASGGTGVVLRLARLYGPGSASREFLEAVRNRSMPIVGGGDNYLSSIHSHDAATALAAAISAPDGTYNVADDGPMRSADNLTTLAAALSAPTPRRVPTWLARFAMGKATGMLTVSHRVSNRAFKSATGWQPAFPTAVEGWEQVVRSNQAA